MKIYMASLTLGLNVCQVFFFNKKHVLLSNIDFFLIFSHLPAFFMQVHLAIITLL